MEEDDFRFLSELDRKVHPTLESRVIKDEEYTSSFKSDYNLARKITSEEIKKIIKILRSKPYFEIYPERIDILGKIGLKIVENVHSDGVQIKPPVLRFLEEQLPEGYNFHRLFKELGKEYKEEDYASDTITIYWG